MLLLEKFIEKVYYRYISKIILLWKSMERFFLNSSILKRILLKEYIENDFTKICNCQLSLMKESDT